MNIADKKKEFMKSISSPRQSKLFYGVQHNALRRASTVSPYIPFELEVSMKL